MRVLRFVGRLGSVTKAAGSLHITQAAASHSIRVLEDVLGVKLLHREPRGTRLTDSGKILFDFSEKLLADIQLAEMQTLNPYSPEAGVLRIGTHETLAIHILPTFLAEFSKEHPKITLSLVSGRIDGLVQSLLRREQHIILSVEPLPHREIHVEPLYRGVMGMFVGKAFGRNTITQDEANELTILTDASAHIRQNLPIPSLLLEHGFKLEKFFELHSFEAAMRLAMKGHGIAIAPEGHAAGYVKDGLLRPIKVQGFPIRKFGEHCICASMLKENSKQPSMKIFFSELLKYCTRHRKSLTTTHK